MKATELRELTNDELLAKIEDLRESIFRLRFRVTLGQSDALKNYRESKRELARINTIMRERELTRQD